MRALAVLLTLAGLAAADAVRVEPRDVEALRAERLDVGERLEVSTTEVARALVDAPAAGTPAQPAEMTPVGTPAGTAVAASHWTYAATVRERAPNAVAAGQFVVELTRDGAPVGTVHLRQSVPDPAARESARVTFDLGPDDPRASLFVVLAREVRPETRLTSGLSPATADYVWRDDAGTENPALAARVGAELVVRVVNGDGTAPHNLAIVGEAGPTDDVEARGDETTLAWTPTREGAYRYECRYHPSMSGTIQVSP